MLYNNHNNNNEYENPIATAAHCNRATLVIGLFIISLQTTLMLIYMEFWLKIGSPLLQGIEEEKSEHLILVKASTINKLAVKF